MSYVNTVVVIALVCAAVVIVCVLIYLGCCTKSERDVNEEFRQKAMEIEKQLENKGIAIRF